MGIGNPGLNFARTIPMCKKIENGEEDGCGLLHAAKPPKGPLPIVLVDRPPVLDRLVSDEMHALILAIVNACPLSDSQGEG